MTHDVLEALNYKVSICNNGKEALDFYAKTWQDIDIVILDIIMPELDGSETFTAMRAINPDIKVLVSSGYSLSGKAKDILDKGGDGFIQKPYGKDELAEKLAGILGL